MISKSISIAIVLVVVLALVYFMFLNENCSSWCNNNKILNECGIINQTCQGKYNDRWFKMTEHQ